MIESFKLPNITPETLTGSICSFNDEYGGLPLKSCVSQISGYQEGSGTPSPSNVRPLHAWSGASLGKCDNNTASLWTIDNSFNGDVEFNQKVAIPSSNVSKTQNNVTIVDNRDGTYTVSTTAEGASADTYIATGNFSKYVNHIYYMFGCPAGGSSSTYNWYVSGINSSNQDKGNGVVERCIESGTGYIVPVYIKSGTIITTPITFKPVCIDLTQMFGSTIADYIYNLETQTAGAGVAFFKALYPNDYYPYNAGTKQLVGDTLAIFTFGQSIYQGYIDWKRGVVVGNAVLADLGDRNWNLITNANGDFFRSLSLPSVKETGIRLCSNYALGNPYVVTTDNIFFVYNSTDTVGGVLVRDARYTDPTAFKTAMNGVMLAYELANPITIPLGGINLLTQEGQNNIYCDTGDTEVKWLHVN